MFFGNDRENIVKAIKQYYNENIDALHGSIKRHLTHGASCYELFDATEYVNEYAEVIKSNIDLIVKCFVYKSNNDINEFISKL